MDEFITLIVVSANEFLSEALDFYQECGRQVRLEPQDQLVVELVNERTAGIVRLCFENQEYVLRTMQVHPDFQKRGLGTLLLDRFEDLLSEKKIHRTFCLAYDHLEKFYGKIGFQKIETDKAPGFLQERALEFARKHPDQSVLIMERNR